MLPWMGTEFLGSIDWNGEARSSLLCERAVEIHMALLQDGRCVSQELMGQD